MQVLCWGESSEQIIVLQYLLVFGFTLEVSTIVLWKPDGFEEKKGLRNGADETFW